MRKYTTRTLLCFISLYILSFQTCWSSDQVIENLIGDRDDFSLNTNIDPIFETTQCPYYFDEYCRYDFGKKTYIHKFDSDLLSGKIISSAYLELKILDMEDGDGEYDTRLFLDDNEIIGAFDSTSGPTISVTVTFQLNASMFYNLTDGELIVVIDTTSGGRISKKGAFS